MKPVPPTHGFALDWAVSLASPRGLLFLQGNVILTDSKYEIMTLLRSHRDDAKGLAIMARHPYPLQTVRLRVPVTPQLLTDAVAAAGSTSLVRGELSVLT